MDKEMKLTAAVFAIIALAILATALVGCTTPPSAAITDPKQVWCNNNVPRRPSVAVVQAMTRPELDALNTYNRKGVAWCGWKF